MLPPAGIGYVAGSWLVTMLVGARARGRVGLVTPTPNGHLPALFGGPFHVQLREWVFVRWIGPLERTRGFLSDKRRAWGCLFHSTKRLCMKRRIKKVVVIHPQGTVPHHLPFSALNPRRSVLVVLVAQLLGAGPQVP